MSKRISKQANTSLPGAIPETSEETTRLMPLVSPEGPVRSNQGDEILPETSEETTRLMPLVNPEGPAQSNQTDEILPDVSEELTRSMLLVTPERPVRRSQAEGIPLDASEELTRSMPLVRPEGPVPSNQADENSRDEQGQSMLFDLDTRRLPAVPEAFAWKQQERSVLFSQFDEDTQELHVVLNTSNGKKQEQQSMLLNEFDEDTQKRLVVLKTSTREAQIRTGSLQAVQTPVVIASKSKGRQSWSLSRAKDPWFLLVLFASSFTSLLALGYFFNTHEILLLGDTYSHMLIARRLFDNLTPGLAQIGGVWLPLPHLLMVPFVWNDYLWNTGLAGSLVAMPCYIVSVCYIFLTARRLTHNNPASFVGTLVFILNPNILYLQTTPLSELVLIATLAMSAYYFVLWAGDDSIVNLIRAGVCIFLATLARYDGWPVFLIMVVLVVVIARLRHHSWARTEAQVIIFSILGGLGIVLWCVWCYIIFKDPLYWQHSMFSSGAQQAELPQQLAFLHTNDVLFDYHNILQSLRTYTLDSVYNVGLLPCILLVISVLVFYLRKGLTPEKVAVLVVLIPFPFYVFSLFTGQAVIFVPRSAPPNATLGLNYYNVRYGVEMVAPAAVFVATLANSIWNLFGRKVGSISSGTRKLVQGKARPVALGVMAVLSLLIIAQSVLIASGGVVSLQEGQFGFDCSPVDPVALFMVQHYNGGLILSDTFTSGTTALGAEADVPFKNMVYEGSGALWTQALAHPDSTVDWVIENPTNANDLVTRGLNVGSTAFLSQFTLELREGNGIELFHRDDASALASNSVPDSLLIAHRLCPTSS